MNLQFWKQPPPVQTVASWADRAVVLICAAAIVAYIVGWIS